MIRSSYSLCICCLPIANDRVGESVQLADEALPVVVKLSEMVLSA